MQHTKEDAVPLVQPEAREEAPTPPSGPDGEAKSRPRDHDRPRSPVVVIKYDARAERPRIPPSKLLGLDAGDEAADEEDDAEDSFDLFGLLGFAGALGVLAYLFTFLFRMPRSVLAERSTSLTILILGALAGGLLYIGLQSLRRDDESPQTADPPTPAGGGTTPASRSTASPERRARAREKPTPRPKPVASRPRRRGKWASALDLATPAIILVGTWLALAAVLGSFIPLSVVPTESMVPTLNPGDLLVIQGADPEDVAVGDLIVFRVPPAFKDYHPSFVVHRVTEVGTDQATGDVTFRTKGDNNPSPDPFVVTGDHLVGSVYTSVPYVGMPVLFLKTPAGFFGFLALVIGASALRGKVAQLTGGRRS